MPTAHETASPRLKATVIPTDLVAEEFALAVRPSARREARLGFLVLLVSDCWVFHNVQARERLSRQFADEGYEFADATWARLSPDRTQYVNRFGTSRLDLSRVRPMPDDRIGLRPSPEAALAEGRV
jgi:hypothetical protein